MTPKGLRKGDEAYVHVFLNKRATADIVIQVNSPNGLTTEVFCDPDVDLLALYETLKSACGAVGYQLNQPRLKEMLEKRIAELKREEEEAGYTDVSGFDVPDIPF